MVDMSNIPPPPPPTNPDTAIETNAPSRDNWAKKFTRGFFYSFLALPISAVGYGLFIYFRAVYRSIIDIQTNGLTYRAPLMLDPTINPSVATLLPLIFVLACAGVWGFIKLYEWSHAK